MKLQGLDHELTELYSVKFETMTVSSSVVTVDKDQIQCTEGSRQSYYV